MKATCCFTFCFALVSPAFSRDFRPEGHMENIPATDSSVQQCYVFRTLPGVRYRVESSNDLNQWTTEEEIYGLGHEIVVAMREFTPPPPPEPGANPPTPLIIATKNVSLLIQSSSAAAGGTMVSWTSLDHGGPVKRLLTQSMTSGWDQVPLFWDTYGDFSYFILHTVQSGVPLEETLPLDTQDAAMFAELENSFALMNQAIDESAARARNAPPPAASDPNSHKFWRVHCDWSIDTDQDGSSDWAEFEMAANGTGGMADGVQGSAFDADINGDGILDGEQLDSDDDGTADAFDIASMDATATFEIGPLPGYAVFPISGPDASSPLQINDKGTVLYSKGTWSGGNWTPLAEDGPGVSFAEASAINDHNRIIGMGHMEVPTDDGTSSIYTITDWASPDALPNAVSTGGSNASHPVPTGGSLVGYLHMYQGLQSGCVLSNDNQFFMDSAQWDPENETLEDGEFGEWTLAEVSGGFASMVPAAAGQLYNFSPDLRWGAPVDIGPGSTTGIVLAPNPLPELPFIPNNVIAAPQNRMIAMSGEPSREALVYHDGAWDTSTTFAKAIDMAEDGTAIGKTHDGLTAPILLNGKWTDIKRAAPDLPELWNDPTVRLLDTTPGGWILARRGTVDIPPDGLCSVMLPLRVEGYYSGTDGVTRTQAVGVDGFSIGSYTPGDEVKDRIWVMAPKGAFNKIIKIKTPLNEGTPLKLSADQIDFTGQASVTLDGPVTPVVLQAKDAAATGSESTATLKLGPPENEVPSVSTPIGFKVMKERVVNLTIYKVTKLYGTTAELKVDELIMPTELEISKYLWNLFRPQINVTFNVNLVETPLAAKWDLNINGSFDSTGIGAPGNEELEILKKVENPPPYDIQMFLVANNGALGSDVSAYGITNRDQRRCWVLGSKFARNRNKEFLLGTIGHEIGHILIGEGHPNGVKSPTAGPAPLPGLNGTLRLMCKGAGSTSDSRLLVKGEWDAAEIWLQERERNGGLGQ